MKRRLSVVEAANESVPITAVLRLLGMDVPDGIGNRKLYCPFGHLYHSDGGAEPTMRVYDDNHAFCFSRCGYFSPVWLASQAWGIPHERAAKELLERVGLHVRSAAEAWREAVEYTPPVDTSSLAEALKLFCARVCPSWSTAQFEPTIAAALSVCLAGLSEQMTEVGAEQWLIGSKEFMRRTFSVADPGHAHLGQ